MSLNQIGNKLEKEICPVHNKSVKVIVNGDNIQFLNYCCDEFLNHLNYLLNQEIDNEIDDSFGSIESGTI